MNLLHDCPRAILLDDEFARLPTLANSDFTYKEDCNDEGERRGNGREQKDEAIRAQVLQDVRAGL